MKNAQTMVLLPEKKCVSVSFQPSALGCLHITSTKVVKSMDKYDGFAENTNIVGRVNHQHLDVKTSARHWPESSLADLALCDFTRLGHAGMGIRRKKNRLFLFTFDP